MTVNCSLPPTPSHSEPSYSGLPSAIWQALVSQPYREKVSSSNYSWLEAQGFAIKFCRFAEAEEFIVLENTAEDTLVLNLEVAQSIYLFDQIQGAVTLSFDGEKVPRARIASHVFSLAGDTNTIRLRLHAKAKIFLLQLPKHKFTNIAKARTKESSVKNLGYQASLSVRHCVEEIDSVSHDTARAKVYLFGKICQLYAAIIEDSFIRPDEDIESINIDVVLSVVKKAEALLKENIASPPTLNFLVKKIGTNRNKLLKSFKSIHGISIFEYCQRERMLRAQFMLKNKAYSVAKVAEFVGYKHPANFSLAYKKHFGEAPKHTQKKSQL